MRTCRSAFQVSQQLLKGCSSSLGPVPVLRAARGSKRRKLLEPAGAWRRLHTGPEAGSETVALERLMGADVRGSS